MLTCALCGNPDMIFSVRRCYRLFGAAITVVSSIVCCRGRTLPSAFWCYNNAFLFGGLQARGSTPPALTGPEYTPRAKSGQCGAGRAPGDVVFCRELAVMTLPAPLVKHAVKLYSASKGSSFLSLLASLATVVQQDF